VHKAWPAVANFTRADAVMQPGLANENLSKPLTMLLFGMVNRMFRWIKPDSGLHRGPSFSEGHCQGQSISSNEKASTVWRGFFLVH
jgi:hypothetical protein